MNRTVALALATALTVFGCKASSDGEPARPTPVRVVTAAVGPAAPAIRTDGMLVNKDELKLSFKVGGIVSHLRVEEGDRVRRGQPLAEIEQAEIDAQVEQARQMLDKSQRDVARAEKLYATHVISLGQLDDLRTQAALSKAALQTTEFNRGYASIVAPEDGVVLRRLAEERELVAVGTPVFVIGSAARGYVVRVDLIDRDIVQVRKGDAADVGLDAHPGEKLTAHVTEIASGADPTSGLFKVELRLDPTTLSLASGLVARVTLRPVSVHGERVYVPLASIVEGSGHRASVFVIAAADRIPVATRRSVEVAFIDGDQVALTSGVAAGERVVAEGALYLTDGERIRPQDAS